MSVIERLKASVDGDVLNKVNPSDLVLMFADGIDTLTGEFDNITLVVDSGSVKPFLEDLKRGITLRTLEAAKEQGHSSEIVCSLLEPEKYGLVQSIGAYAAIYKAVELEMPAITARRLAHDLKRGIDARGKSVDEIIEDAREGY